MNYTESEIAALVEPTRVHRNVYTDPEIFDLEMERIWAKSWIYIGHESQVPEPTRPQQPGLTPGHEHPGDEGSEKPGPGAE